MLKDEGIFWASFVVTPANENLFAGLWTSRYLGPNSGTLRMVHGDGEYVSPQTGPLAAFAESDAYNIAAYLASPAGKEFDVVVKDSQSNPTRAADVGKELILSGGDGGATGTRVPAGPRGVLSADHMAWRPAAPRLVCQRVRFDYNRLSRNLRLPRMP